MSVSESQKAASLKWDRENMRSLSCKVTKDVADKFKEICIQKGTNTNAVLLSYVKEFIRINSEAEAQEQS